MNRLSEEQRNAVCAVIEMARKEQAYRTLGLRDGCDVSAQAYRLKASNACLPFSTLTGTMPRFEMETVIALASTFGNIFVKVCWCISKISSCS
jgi:hypothetical protein